MEPPSATQNPAADLRPTSPRKTYLKTLHAYIVDDGIGECGERLVATVSGQFPDAEIVMHICAHVRDVDMVKPVVKEASSAQGIIAHTIVEQELKAYLEQLAAEYQVPCLDLVSEFVNKLEIVTGVAPARVPGLYLMVQDRHFRFCDAMKYVLNHDDGTCPEEWWKADALLLGVSRVGKTPLRFKHLKVTKVDVTRCSIQSTANKIIRYLGDRFGDDDGSPATPASRYYPMNEKASEGFGKLEEQKQYNIFVVTTGIGYCGERMAAAVIAQFKEVNIRVEVLSHVTEERLDFVISEVVRLQGLVCSTVVVDTIRQLLEKKCEENGIFCVDLFGPMMKLLSEKLTMPPVEVPGIYQRNDEQYFKFCRAVEFALDHDDGANPSGWVNADAILLGVSRVGKSPLSVFLGTLGLKVANYPICPGVELPDAINKVDRRSIKTKETHAVNPDLPPALVPKELMQKDETGHASFLNCRVFGLLVDPEILAEHREDRRQRTMMRSMATGYSNMKQVMQELEDVEEMFKKRKFVKINVTGMPMESVADRIIKLLGDRFSEYSFDDEPVLNKRYQPL